MPVKKLEVLTGPWLSRKGIKYKNQMEIVLGILNRMAKGGVIINNKAINKWYYLLECPFVGSNKKSIWVSFCLGNGAELTLCTGCRVREKGQMLYLSFTRPFIHYNISSRRAQPLPGTILGIRSSWMIKWITSKGDFMIIAIITFWPFLL